MSRIGKKPIAIPKGVTVSFDGNTVKVQGPKGKLDTPLPSGIKMEQKDGNLLALRENDSQAAIHGLARAGEQCRGRRHQGLDERTRDRRDWISRGDERQGNGGIQPRLLASDLVAAAHERRVGGSARAESTDVGEHAPAD